MTFIRMFLKRTDCIPIAFEPDRIVCAVSFEFLKIFI